MAGLMLAIRDPALRRKRKLRIPIGAGDFCLENKILGLQPDDHLRYGALARPLDPGKEGNADAGMIADRFDGMDFGAGELARLSIDRGPSFSFIEKTYETQEPFGELMAFHVYQLLLRYLLL